MMSLKFFMNGLRMMKEKILKMENLGRKHPFLMGKKMELPVIGLKMGTCNLRSSGLLEKRMVSSVNGMSLVS